MNILYLLLSIMMSLSVSGCSASAAQDEGTPPVQSSLVRPQNQWLPEDEKQWAYYVAQVKKSGCPEIYYNAGCLYEKNAGKDKVFLSTALDCYMNVIKAESVVDVDTLVKASEGLARIISRFERGAHEEDSWACLQLSLCYKFGKGVPPHNDRFMELTRRAAGQGHPLAQFNLGKCYLTGDGVAEDWDQAKEWLEKSADQGASVAQFNLAFLYQKTERATPLEIVSLYRRAAAQGYVPALLRLMNLYKEGYGVEEDPEKATALWADPSFRVPAHLLNKAKRHSLVLGDEALKIACNRIAAEQGDAVSQFILADHYTDGVRDAPSVETAWLEQAVKGGMAKAMHNLALNYHFGTGVAVDLPKALTLYRRAAHMGQGNSLNNLIILYSETMGEEFDTTPTIGPESPLFIPLRNLHNATYLRQGTQYEVACHRLGAEQGDARSQYNLGSCYDEGEGVPQDWARAVAFYRRAADQGYARAQYSLGQCYLDGEGVEENPEEAVRLLGLAAAQENADAQLSLGRCYLNGKGVEENPKEAARLFGLAAAQENADAQVELGVCYEDGEGIEKDVEQAIKWYKRAADQGNEKALENLKNLGVHYVAEAHALSLFQGALEQFSLEEKDTSPENSVQGDDNETV